MLRIELIITASVVPVWSSQHLEHNAQRQKAPTHSMNVDETSLLIIYLVGWQLGNLVNHELWNCNMLVERRSRRPVRWQETNEQVWSQRLVIALMLWCLWWCFQGSSSVGMAPVVHTSGPPMVVLDATWLRIKLLWINLNKSG